MNTMDFRRQTGIFNPSGKICSIGVVGCGGIGSAFVTIISKMGISDIEVWDHDFAEEYNIPNQFLPIESVGVNKTIALNSQTIYTSGVALKCHEKKFEQGSLLGRLAPTILVMAVDNMSIRKMIFEEARKAIGIELIIDGRMSGETYTIVSTLSDYMESWHEQPEEDIPCSEKAIIYNTMAIGSDMAIIVKKFLNKEKFPKVIKGDCKNFIKLTGDDYKWLIHRKQ